MNNQPNIVAEKLIVEMAYDNGVINRFNSQFDVLNRFKQSLIFTLADSVLEMQKEGFEFTKQNIVELTCGEVSEVENKFGSYKSFKRLTEVLNEVFGQF